MSEGRRVDQDEGGAVIARGLHAVDQFVFGVGLEALQCMTGGFGATGEVGIDFGQGRVAIDRRLAGAEQVEVGAMQDQQLRHRWISARGRRSLAQAGGGVQTLTSKSATFAGLRSTFE